MDILQLIRTSGKKGKDLNLYVAALFEKNNPSQDDFARAIIKGKDNERGVCIEGLEYLTQTQPQLVKPYLSIIINCLTDKAPRVKWEAARVIANIAALLPKDIEPAIPSLIKNTSDPSTVVRWSTALALGEIAKSNPSLTELISRIKTLSEKEENNGVKNVYHKALKQLKV
jgi:hypothetical protein